jgi:type II secretory pathway component PulC
MTGSPRLDLIVIRAHLFGVSVPAETADPAAANVALVLTGVFARQDPHAGLAIVAQASRASQLYSIGGRLPDGAVLREVYADRAVAERDGVLELLRLPRTTRGAVHVAMVSPGAPAWAGAQTAGVPGQLILADPHEFSLARSWFSGFTPEPATEQGRFVGYRLMPEPRYEREYGVKRGDLVTAINGVPFDSPDAGAALLQNASGKTVEITVQREGVVLNMTLPVDGAS